MRQHHRQDQSAEYPQARRRGKWLAHGTSRRWPRLAREIACKQVGVLVQRNTDFTLRSEQMGSTLLSVHTQELTRMDGRTIHMQ